MRWRMASPVWAAYAWQWLALGCSLHRCALFILLLTDCSRVSLMEDMHYIQS